MPDKAYFDKKLAEARDLVAAGEFAQARAALDRLAGEQERGLMGEDTAFGLPRRLHSVHLRLAKALGDEVSRTGYQYLLVPPPEVLAPYGRFSGDERRMIAAVNRQPVPKILHQIWIGSKPVPASTQAWASHAKRNGLDYRLWREADLEREGITSNPQFSRMLDDGDYPGAVDVARYLILLKFGGIYLDCDFYPARDDVSFFDTLPMIGLTAFGEEVPRKTGQGSLLLANSFIAAPPGHPVFSRMLDAFPDILKRLPKAPAWWATGPLIFTVVARAGSVTLAAADFVVETLPDRAPFSAVEAVRSRAGADGDGLLIAWKSW
ncbi:MULTISPECIES: glycosyltransferase family 32 protein [unclassified Rhizobium]|uniref:glycosyltransferase family 32 protein n=1 Tax=unclassified Rhizobium TaxID=2613769 RepID=UPI001782C2CA|nr:MULTISPECIES: glycosyltransferase [unclassified Rhizobium]MBD8688101.1 mannosyltransferase [Rhizobium sp. CFBP 13644]MBD8692556.1 mannosyltransferase [Rhizobium sp. CFBP 13717]